MFKKELRDGIVVCPDCQKEVPDGNICIYCGWILKELPLPRLTPMEVKVLKCLKEGASSIDDILDCADSTKESVRVVVSSMLKLGLVARTRRGRYSLTKAGEWGIEREIETVVVASKKVEQSPLFTPQYISRNAAYKLLKGGGVTRAGAGSVDTLIKILEGLGDEISTKAVELAVAAGRKTVVLTDVEQAIQEVVGVDQSNVREVDNDEVML